MKLIILLSGCAFILVSCTTKSQTYPDISYGADARQKMDIYLPAGRSGSGTKTIAVIHGGGWTGGDKSDMSVVIDSLRTKLPGYAFININYRLVYNNTNLFPTQENDIKTAVDFYLDRSPEYKISKELVMLGASAGGHLALLYGYKNNADRHVKAIVDFFGPSDLTTFWNTGPTQQLILASVTGKLYDQEPGIYNQSSPVNFITAQSPPTIVLQGGADSLVPAVQSTSLIDKLEEKGVINQLVYYEKGGHGDWPLSVYSDAFDKIQAFISGNVH